MKMKSTILGITFLSIICITFTGGAYGQATNKQYVAEFGAAFTQATVTNARTGFFGLDLFAGKMLTNNLCLGLSIGHDIVSYRKIEDYHERLTVIPALVKAKYFINIGPRLQLYTSVGGGVYRASPHLTTEPIGDIRYTTNQPGGAVGFGIDYWFLLLQGVGVSFEYHFFNTDEESIFSFFAFRLDYCFIKF